MMFLCFPMIFIISISEIRSDRSFSVASAGGGGGDINQTGVITVLASRPLHSSHPNTAALGESDLRLSPRTLLGEKLFVKWERTQAVVSHFTNDTLSPRCLFKTLEFYCRRLLNVDSALLFETRRLSEADESRHLLVWVFLLREAAASLTFQHFDGHLGHPVRLLLVQAQRLAHHHLTEAAFAQRLSENQSAQTKSHQTVRTQRWLSRMFSPPRVVGGSWPYLSRGSSQRGSWGSSYSDTPDSIGEPLEERREGRTSITPEWMEELESTET